MTVRDQSATDPVFIVWLTSTIAAIAVSSTAPAWAVVFCVPAAGLATLLITRRRRRIDEDRLRRLIDGTISIEDPGTAAGQHATEIADPIDRLGAHLADLGAQMEKQIARRDQSIKMLRANLDAIDTPVIATDDAGRISLLNHAAERLFPRPPGRAAGLPFEDVLTSSALLELHAFAERGEACTRQARLTIDGVPRVYEVAAVPVRPDGDESPAGAQGRRGVVLTIKDVHELAQTLQLRTDFASNASHELRTPIASIRAAVETMRGPAEHDAGMRVRLLGVLESNVARLEEIVSDLLDLSQLESEGEPRRVESFDLSEMTRTLGAVFESACQKRGLTIHTESDPPSIRIRTDRKLLMLVLRNLIDNATKFAFENTTIRVRCTTLNARADDGNEHGIRIAVNDTGIGIPLKHQERIFERFYQVDESRARVGTRRGSGLGLAIVRHALRRLDGRITVESVWQEGTTMIVEIPRCVEHTMTTRPRPTG